MAENNTLRRARFNYLFGLLSVYAGIRGIRFIHGRDSYIRTAERQNELYKQGKSKADGYKVKSKHQYQLARDLYVADENGKIIWDEKPYKILADFWKRLGGVWGGEFQGIKDNFHYEL